jgi:hypothetical protein
VIKHYIHYEGITLLSTICKVLSSIILWMFSQYAEDIILDHQSGFWCNGSATYIFGICQVLEKHGNTVLQYMTYLWTSRKLMIRLGVRLYIIYFILFCVYDYWSCVWQIFWHVDDLWLISVCRQAWTHSQRIFYLFYISLRYFNYACS